MSSLSIILPVLDEAATIGPRLAALGDLPGAPEVIVVDGGSSDGTAALAEAAGYRTIVAPRGRGSQMNAGAVVAGGEVLLFLHADTALPAGALDEIRRGLAAGCEWGRFDVDIVGGSAWFPLISRLINLRSRLSGIATGDQAIFVRRPAFDAVGGYPDIALMEDLALSSTLRRRGRPYCSRMRVRTSGRRWEKHGVLKTVRTMWWLRLRYFFGADPARLAAEYGYRPRQP